MSSSDQNSTEQRNGASDPSPPDSHGADVALQAQLLSLVNQAASFQTFMGPTEIRSVDGPGGAIGFSGTEELHRFQVDLQLPSMGSGLRASNTVGEKVAEVKVNWLIMPDDFVARPGVQPPPTTLDPTRSQRFVMLDTTFNFENGVGGFRSFGGGRTFPMMVAGRHKLVAAAVGVILDPSGKFQGHDGNFTLCGIFDPRLGFIGNIMMRILDPNGDLRTSGDLPAIQPTGGDLDPEATFLTWIAQKRADLSQENAFSVNSDAVPRGLNIPLDLHRVRTDFALGPSGFKSLSLNPQELVGLELGFTALLDNPQGDSALQGTPLNPLQFEGTAEYTFYDAEHRPVGGLTANFIEGKSFKVDLAVPAGRTALRFGYFAPIITGWGCFEGAEGILYGAAGSVFAPPPASQVMSNLYMARLYDPTGRFRTAVAS